MQAFMKEFKQMQKYMSKMGKEMGGLDPGGKPSAESPFGGLGDPSGGMPSVAGNR